MIKIIVGSTVPMYQSQFPSPWNWGQGQLSLNLIALNENSSTEPLEDSPPVENVNIWITFHRFKHVKESFQTFSNAMILKSFAQLQDYVQKQLNFER